MSAKGKLPIYVLSLTSIFAYIGAGKKSRDYRVHRGGAQSLNCDNFG